MWCPCTDRSQQYGHKGQQHRSPYRPTDSSVRTDCISTIFACGMRKTEYAGQEPLKVSSPRVNVPLIPSISSAMNRLSNSTRGYLPISTTTTLDASSRQNCTQKRLAIFSIAYPF